MRLTLAVLLGLVLYLGFLPFVWWMLPDTRRLDTVVRLGIALPYAVMTCIVIRVARRHSTQQLAAGSLALLYSVWLCIIVALSGAPAGQVFITSNSIVILFVIVMMRLSVTFAAILSLAIALGQLAASHVIGGYPVKVSAIAFVINISIAFPSLYALFELNNERRRSFRLAVRDRELLAELDARNRDLDKLSETDALTGILNRRGLDRYTADHAQGADMSAIACLLIDADRFKPYNDTYGHPAGDRVLVQIARAIEAACEPSDIVCRYGGEEFAVIRMHGAMPGDGVSGDDALEEWAERVRRGVEDLALPHAFNAPAGVVTVSIGAAAAGRGTSVRSVVAAADRSLYAAKSAGRNRVVNHARLEDDNNVVVLKAGAG